VTINALTLFLFFIVAGLMLLILFMVYRMTVVSRRMKEAEENAAGSFMASAMGEAVARMRDHEKVLAARAAATELPSDQIIDSLPSGLLVTDAAGEPKRLNPAAARLLGLASADAQAGLWTQLGAAGVSIRALIDECLGTGAGSSRRSIVIESSPPGSRRHLGAGVSPLRDADGTITGAICLFTDITSVVDLEDQLRLKDSLARLGELTAGLAHEFRNGLATIHGYARLMNTDRLPADHREYVESLRAETHSLTEIVANFLAFAKPTHPAYLPTALAPIVARAADDIQADAHKHGGGIDVAGDFAEIEGDDVMVRQALINLLRNAVEACAEAGTPPRVLVRGVIDRPSGLQRITVSDNGPGILPGAGQKLFQPFFTTRGRGTGLGLALVQKIIVSHNGRVTFRNLPAGGAEFTIVLPVSQSRN
jgi:PAS domain S-box-containing protein